MRGTGAWGVDVYSEARVSFAAVQRFALADIKSLMEKDNTQIPKEGHKRRYKIEAPKRELALKVTI